MPWAASKLASRGHDVVLFEKKAQLGGFLHGETGASFKADLRRYLKWSVRETVQNQNIDVRLSIEAAPELIAREKADALVLALGAVPNIPVLTFFDKPRVLYVGDIEDENDYVGENILIVGAGLTGCETALKYLQAGKRVTLIDAHPGEKLGLSTSPINAYYLYDILEKHHVDMQPDTKLIDVTKE